MKEQSSVPNPEEKKQEKPVPAPSPDSDFIPSKFDIDGEPWF